MQLVRGMDRTSRPTYLRADGERLQVELPCASWSTESVVDALLAQRGADRIEALELVSDGVARRVSRLDVCDEIERRLAAGSLDLPGLLDLSGLAGRINPFLNRSDAEAGYARLRRWYRAWKGARGSRSLDLEEEDEVIERQLRQLVLGERAGGPARALADADGGA